MCYTGSFSNVLIKQDSLNSIENLFFYIIFILCKVQQTFKNYLGISCPAGVLFALCWLSNQPALTKRVQHFMSLGNVTVFFMALTSQKCFPPYFFYSCHPLNLQIYQLFYLYCSFIMHYTCCFSTLQSACTYRLVKFLFFFSGCEHYWVISIELTAKSTITYA